MSAVHELATAASLAGSAPAVILYTLIFSALLAKKREWASLLAVGASVGVAGVVTWGLKALVARQRPDGAIVDSWDSPWGFPSGHMAMTVAFTGIGLYVMWCSARGVRYRETGTALGFAYVATVCASRLILGAHDALDLVGGGAVGAVAVASGVGLMRFAKPLLPTSRDAHGRVDKE